MKKTLKDLFMAMLNATLILVVIALLLLVLALTKANSLSASFAQSLAVIEPLETAIETINTEVGAMKADIAELRSQSEGISFTKLEELEAKLEKMDAHLTDIKASTKTLSETPGLLLDDAVSSVADQTVAGVARLKGCVPE